MTRPPRGTGYCRGCARRILLTTQGKLFLHSGPTGTAMPPAEPTTARCPGSMTRNYKPGPDFTYPKETP